MFELYVRHEWWFAAVQLALAMLGMGATLSVTDFVGVFRQPRAFVTGALVQIIGTPLLALALNAALGLPPGIAFGLLLVSAMPGGAMSNVATYFAKGSVALSIALTAVITLACIATTPLVLRLLAGDVMRADFVMPVGAIAIDIAVCLLVPLLLGMAIGTLLGSTARRGAMARWCIRLSLTVVLCIAIGSAGAGRLQVGAESQTPLAAIALLAVLCQVAGTVPGLLLGLPRAELAAIAIENSIRNTNLALLLKASLFPVVPGVADPLADGVLFAALLYAGLSGPLSIPLILGHRWLARGEPVGQ
jgi:BASS family bile acid:Na+ symporter